MIKKLSILIDVANKEGSDILNRNLQHIRALTGVDKVSVVSAVPKPEASPTAVFAQR
ncbi:MAG: hypothetical protein SV775_18860 [Thermodesulfobacteriota bacterium]|nr:hypothetical protein [Thermodesulfobacteriota bacterium]